MFLVSTFPGETKNKSIRGGAELFSRERKIYTTIAAVLELRRIFWMEQKPFFLWQNSKLLLWQARDKERRGIRSAQNCTRRRNSTKVSSQECWRKSSRSCQGSRLSKREWARGTSFKFREFSCPKHDFFRHSRPPFSLPNFFFFEEVVTFSFSLSLFLLSARAGSWAKFPADNDCSKAFFLLYPGTQVYKGVKGTSR